MSFSIRFENISFAYPKKKSLALNNVSFDVPKGAFFALLGANGAGKTTLLRLLSKRLIPSEGNISYSSVLLENGELSRQSLGILLENPGAYEQLSVQEYLELFATLYGNIGFAKEGLHLLEKLQFSESYKIRVGKLSLGNKQKLQIARAMQHSPQCLLLDEPAANLDPISRELLWNLLSQWRENGKRTLIVCSHILPELEKFTTDFVILEKGRVSEQGQIKKEETHLRTLLEIDVKNLALAKTVLESAGISASEYSLEKTGVLNEAYRKVYGKKITP